MRGTTETHGTQFSRPSTEKSSRPSKTACPSCFPLNCPSIPLVPQKLTADQFTASSPLGPCLTFFSNNPFPLLSMGHALRLQHPSSYFRCPSNS